MLVEITINGTLHRVSTYDRALTHLWKSEIASFSEMQIKLDSKYGGYARPTFGNIDFLPSLFSDPDDWNPQPPISCPIVIKYSSTTEEAATTLFTGTAHLKSVSRDSIIYSLYPPEYDVSVDEQAFSDTLVNVASWCCGASYLNLTLDSTKARATSPAVTHTTGDVILLDELSKICAFYSHYFYISGSTLYLVDMFHTEDMEEITEFDVMAPYYEYPSPYSKLTSADSSIDGSCAYGDPYNVAAYHDTDANIVAALGKIKTLVEKGEMIVPFPTVATAPAIGEFRTLTDESLENPKATTILTSEINYNFDEDVAVVRGLDVSSLWEDTAFDDADTVVD